MALANAAVARQVPPTPLFDEAALEADFGRFMKPLAKTATQLEYPGVIRKLLTNDSEQQIQAVKMLAETGELHAIPWLLLFLENTDQELRIWSAASLEKLVARLVRQRPEAIQELKPLAWIVLKMFRHPDDGNTHAYAAAMTRHLGLRMFERELKRCLQSPHPGVVKKAAWALEAPSAQNEQDKQ